MTAMTEALFAFSCLLGQLEFDREEIDVGTVEVGEPVDVAFHYRNASQSVIAITSVQTSCGCTVAKEGPRRIPVGGVGKLEFSINTAGKDGAVRQQCVVEYEHSKGVGRRDLAIAARVVPKGGVLVRPSGVDLGLARPAQEFHAELTVEDGLRRYRGHKVRVGHRPGWVAAEVRPTDEGAWRVRLSGLVPATVGRQSEAVRFQLVDSGGKSAADFNVPIRWNVASRISLDPARLVKLFKEPGEIHRIRASAEGGPLSLQSLHVRRLSGGSVEAVAEPPAPSGSSHAGLAGSAVTLALSTPSHEGGLHRGELVATFDIDGTPETVKVPYLFIPRKKVTSRETD